MGIIYKTKHFNLWTLEQDLSLEALTLRANLDQNELTKLATINGAERQALWLAVRVMAKEELNAKIAYLDSGKPILTDEQGTPSQTNISISHTQNTAAFAFGTLPLGIDIENIERDASRAVRKFAQQSELELAQEHFPENPHLLVWCAKEALYKAHGMEGVELKNEISLMSISRSGEIKCRVRDSNYVCHYQIFQNYLITLAIKDI